MWMTPGTVYRYLGAAGSSLFPCVKHGDLLILPIGKRSVMSLAAKEGLILWSAQSKIRSHELAPVVSGIGEGPLAVLLRADPKLRLGICEAFNDARNVVERFAQHGVEMVITIVRDDAVEAEIWRK